MDTTVEIFSILNNKVTIKNHDFPPFVLSSIFSIYLRMNSFLDDCHTP